MRRPVLAGADALKNCDGIPIIDLANLTSDNIEERRALAQLLRKTCSEVGFFYARNHGVPKEVVKDTYDAVQDYFNLPQEEKLKNHISNSAAYRGFSPIKYTSTDEAKRGDLCEAFLMMNDDNDEFQHWPKRAKSAGPLQNQWPEGDTKFREAMSVHYNYMQDLASKLSRSFCLALDLPEDYLDNVSDFGAGGLRGIHYPTQEIGDESGFSLAAHADYCAITILWQQEELQCLEVLSKNGTWVQATPIPDTFVINIGDLFQLIANHKLKSTIHRVVNRSGKDRISIAFFWAPNEDAQIQTLPTCLAPGEEPVQVKVGEFLRGGFKANLKPATDTIKA